MPVSGYPSRHRSFHVIAMRAFSKLRVWQDGYAFVLAVYRLTSSFPAAERYGITSQLQRAAVSIATNLAEGAKRESPAEFVRFINIAEASLAEVQYLLLLSKDLGYCSEDTALTQHAAGIAGQLHTLKAAIRRQHAA
jgi:four helix bundle protein